MNVTDPTISVVIPLYNKEKTIKRALDSIMKQTVLPQEIIVVDDGSTDGSRAVVEQEHNPLVMLFCQENSGVSAARNRGIREARGAWIAFLDADDEWEPGYLEQIDRMIRQFPSSIGAATAYFLGNEQGSKRRMTLRKLPFTTESGVLSNYFQVAVHSDPPVWTSAVCV
ncbi:MAG TPA: glycosyltransferase family A protein, partial [Bacteroidales bacterium]|nr:glycosyltransferase family A protein [Bacteroidales bacterium]